MRIKEIKTLSPLLNCAELDADKSVFVFKGKGVFMEMLRCAICEENIKIADSDFKEAKSDDCAFMNKVTLEIYGETVELISVLLNDHSFEIIMKADECHDEKKSSILEYLSKQASDEKNTYTHHTRYCDSDNDILSESDRILNNLKVFIKIAREEGEKGDTRPIYVYDFERIDEATDITPFIDALATLDRQVFVGVSNTYPIERFESDKVQLV